MYRARQVSSLKIFRPSDTCQPVRDSISIHSLMSLVANTPIKSPSNLVFLLHKAGHLYKQTIIGTWQLRFFVLEGRVLYCYKQEGDPVPTDVLLLTNSSIRFTKHRKLYCFCITQRNKAKAYNLAATLPKCMEDWIQALHQASSFMQNPNSSPSATQMTTTSRTERLHSAFSFVDSSLKELVDVPGVSIPDAYCHRLESLLAEFVNYARDDADGWQLQTNKCGVKAYVRRACRLGMLKGVGFIAHHPYKILQQVLEVSRRHKYDPQLLATQCVQTFNNHTWVDHLTYKAVFPAVAKDFVNLMHWRVLADESIVAVATYANDDIFIKKQEPQFVRGKTIMTGFLITPNEDYTGASVTYITKMNVKAGVVAHSQTQMLVQQVFVVDNLRKALDKDKSSPQYDRVSNATLFSIFTTHEKETEAIKLQSMEVTDQDDHGETCSRERVAVVPIEGFPAVPEEYSDIIEKAVVRMEAELNDKTSWDFVGKKDGVKAYIKVDGSLTAAKGVGFLAYHPRVIWDQFVDVAKRKSVDHHLALGKNMKSLDAQTNIDYLEYNSIVVVAGRDFCNLLHWRVLPGGTIIVVMQSIEELELCPLKEPTVIRADLHFACIKIVPNAAYDGAMVTTMVKIDLKGSIPGRIAGKVAAEQPFVISRMREVIKARCDLDQVAAQGKLTNTVFELPNERSLSSDSATSVRSSIIDEVVVVEKCNVSALSSGPTTPPCLRTRLQTDMVSSAPTGICKASETQTSTLETIEKPIEVVENVKSGTNTANDLAMYVIQFGCAVLALKTVDLPKAIHFVLVIVLIQLFFLKTSTLTCQVSSK